MIEWPNSQDETTEKVLSRFKETSLAAELEDDARTWSFLAWARKPEPPARMILRSDSGETATFTLDRAGLWRKED